MSHEEGLVQCVFSIQKQLGVSWEVDEADDGSTCGVYEQTDTASTTLRVKF